MGATERRKKKNYQLDIRGKESRGGDCKERSQRSIPAFADTRRGYSRKVETQIRAGRRKEKKKKKRREEAANRKRKKGEGEDHREVQTTSART